MNRSLIFGFLCFVLIGVAFTNAEEDSRGIMYKLETRGKYFSTAKPKPIIETTIESKPEPIIETTIESKPESIIETTTTKNSIDELESIERDRNDSYFDQPIGIVGTCVLVFMVVVIIGCVILYCINARNSSRAYPRTSQRTSSYIRNLLTSS